MSAKIVPGAALGNALSGRRTGPALMPVRRRRSRPHPARHDRPTTWGDPLRLRPDWGFVAFAVCWTAVMAAAALIGAAR